MKQSNFLKAKIETLLLGLKKESAILALQILLNPSSSSGEPNLSHLTIEEITSKNKLFGNLMHFAINPQDASWQKLAEDLILEDEENVTTIIHEFIHQKLKELDKLNADALVRPQYQKAWLDFENSVQLHKDEEKLLMIDKLRVQQINENRPHHWFYRKVFLTVLKSDWQKELFSSFQPLTSKWLEYEIKAEFNDAELTKIDSIIKSVEDANQSVFVSFRLIFNHPELLGKKAEDPELLLKKLGRELLREKQKEEERAAKQFAYFVSIFDKQSKWLFFEKEAADLGEFTEKQMKIIDSYLQQLYANQMDDKTFIQQIEKHKDLLNEWQKVKLRGHYQEYFLGMSEINPMLAFRNLESPSKRNAQKRSAEKISPTIIEDDSKSDDDDDNNEVKSRKTKKPKHETKRKEKNTPKKQRAKKKEVKITLTNSEEDKAILKGLAKFKQTFQGGSTNTQGAQRTIIINHVAFLKSIIKITADEKLSDTEKEQFGQRILKRLHDLIPNKNSWRSHNILFVDKNGEWKEHNMYYNKNNEKIALTLPEDTPVGVVAIRGTTAATFSERVICDQNAFNNDTASTTNTASTSYLNISKQLSNSQTTKTSNPLRSSLDDETESFVHFAKSVNRPVNGSTSSTSISTSQTTATTVHSVDDLDPLDSIFDVPTDDIVQTTPQKSEREELIARYKQALQEKAEFDEEIQKIKSTMSK